MNTKKITLWQRICSAVLALALIFSMLPETLVSYVRAMELAGTLTITGSDDWKIEFSTASSSTNLGTTYLALLPDVGVTAGETISSKFNSSNAVSFNAFETWISNANDIIGLTDYQNVGFATNDTSIVKIESKKVTVTQAQLGNLPDISSVYTALKTMYGTAGFYVRGNNTLITDPATQLAGGIPYVAVLYSQSGTVGWNVATGTYAPAAAAEAKLVGTEFVFNITAKGVSKGEECFANDATFTGAVWNEGTGSAEIEKIDVSLYANNSTSVTGNVIGKLYDHSKGSSVTTVNVSTKGDAYYLNVTAPVALTTSVLQTGYANIYYSYTNSEGKTEKKVLVLPVRFVGDATNGTSVGISAGHITGKAGDLSKPASIVYPKADIHKSSTNAPKQTVDDLVSVSQVSNNEASSVTTSVTSPWVKLVPQGSVSDDILYSDKNDGITTANLKGKLAADADAVILQSGQWIAIELTEAGQALPKGTYVETLEYIFKAGNNNRYTYITVYIEVQEAEVESPTLTAGYSPSMNNTRLNMDGSGNDLYYKYDKKDWGEIKTVELVTTGGKVVKTLAAGDWSVTPDATGTTGRLTLDHTKLDDYITELTGNAALKVRATFDDTGSTAAGQGTRTASADMFVVWDFSVTVNVTTDSNYTHGDIVLKVKDTDSGITIVGSATVNETTQSYTYPNSTAPSTTKLDASKTYTVWIGGVKTTETLTVSDKTADLHFGTLRVVKGTGAGQVGVSRTSGAVMPGTTELNDVLKERATPETFYLYAAPAAGKAGQANWSSTGASVTNSALSGTMTTAQISVTEATTVTASYTTWTAAISTVLSDNTPTNTEVTDMWLINKDSTDEAHTTGKASGTTNKWEFTFTDNVRYDTVKIQTSSGTYTVPLEYGIRDGGSHNEPTLTIYAIQVQNKTTTHSGATDLNANAWSEVGNNDGNAGIKFTGANVTTTLLPAGTIYAPAGAELKLDKNADTGYRFVKWTDKNDATISGNSYKVGTTGTAADDLITANFEPTQITWIPAGKSWKYGDSITAADATWNNANPHTATSVTYTINNKTALPMWLQSAVSDGTKVEIGTVRPNTVGTYQINVTATSSNGMTVTKDIKIEINKATPTISVTDDGATSHKHFAGQTTSLHMVPTVSGPYYNGDASSTYDASKWVTVVASTSPAANELTGDLSYSPATFGTGSTETVTMTVAAPEGKDANAEATLSNIWDKTTATTTVNLAASVAVTVNVKQDGALSSTLHSGKTVTIKDSSGNALASGTLTNGTVTLKVITGNNYTIEVAGTAVSGTPDALARTKVQNITAAATVEFNYWTISTSVDTACSGMGTVSYDSTKTVQADGVYYDGDSYKVAATPTAGYHFVGWKVNNAGSTSNTSASIDSTLTATTTYVAVFAPNTVTITKMLNGVADSTTNRTITLYSDAAGSGTWTATSFTDTSANATVTFTEVPNGTYQIWDATGWTDLKVTVANNDPTEVKIYYYTVKFASAVTNGSYTSATTGDKEVISNGDAGTNRNKVTLPDVQPANANYDFEKWDNAPTGSGSNDAGSHITAGTQVVSGATWTITDKYSTDVTAEGGITLTASYVKARYSLTVTVKNNDVVDGTTTVTIKESMGTTTVGTLSAANSGTTYVFDGLTKSTTYRIYTALDGSSNYYEVTMPANSDATATLTYVNYDYDVNYPTGVISGESGMPANSTQPVLTNGKTAATIAYTVPTLPGYRFDGWAVDSASASASWTGGNYTIENTRATDIKFYAKWTTNKVQIVVNLNNDPNDTKANTVQLMPGTGTAISAGSGATSITNPTGNNGTMTFEGITAGTYTIWVNSATTGKTITVNDGADMTETLNYYTVTYIAVNDTDDHGHYAAGSTPAAGEVLLGGMTTGTANLNYVTLPATAAASGTSYKAVVWTETDNTGSGTGSGSGSWDPAANNTTNNATKWTINTAPTGSGVGIYLKPTFVRDGYSLTVQVKLDNTLQTSTVGTKVSIDGGTNWTAVDASGNAVFSNLNGTATGTITVNDGTNTYRDTQNYTMANDDQTVTLEYFTVTAAAGTGASSASVTDPSLSGSTAYANGIVMKGKTATLTSAPASGYGGTVTWTLTESNGSGSSVSGNTVTVNSTVTATASYQPNKIEVTVYINGALDGATATKTVTLVDKDTSTTLNTTPSYSNGVWTFTQVPQNTSGYDIYVGGSATGVPAVTAAPGGTETATLTYYTVEVKVPTIDGGTTVVPNMGTTANSSAINAGTPASGKATSVELLKESSTQNVASIVATNHNVDYNFKSWGKQPDGGTLGSSAESTTFTLTKSATGTTDGPIVLTPYYSKDKASLTVNVYVNGSLVGASSTTDATEATVTLKDSSGNIVGGSAVTTTNGTYTFSGLQGTYTLSTDKDGNTETKSVTITGSTDVSEDLKYVTYTFDVNTPADATAASLTAATTATGDTVMEGRSISWAGNATLSGWKFVGWNTNQANATAGTATWTSANYTAPTGATAGITFYAAWKANVVKITVNENNGGSDARANTITLVDSTGATPVKYAKKEVTSDGSGVVTFTGVENGTGYQIHTTVSGSATTHNTNHTISVTEGDTTTQTLNYYTVEIKAPIDKADTSTTPTAIGTATINSGTTAVILLSGGTTGDYDATTNPNADNVKVNSTVTNTSYTFDNWYYTGCTGAVTVDSATSTNLVKNGTFKLTGATDKVTIQPKYTKSGFDLTLTIQLDGVATENIEITLNKDGTTFGTPTNTDASGNVTFHGLTGGKYTMTAIDKRTGVTVTAPVNWNGTRTWDWTSHGTDNVTETVNFYTLTTSVGTGAVWAVVDNTSTAPSTTPAPATNSMVFLEQTGAAGGTNTDNTAYLFSEPAVGYGGTVTWTDTAGTSTITASGMELTTTINTAQASYGENIIKIAVYKNGVLDTSQTRKLYLYSGGSVVGSGVTVDASGYATFNKVPTSASAYAIYDEVSSTPTDTGLTVSVTPGGTNDSTVIYYYDVVFEDVTMATDHGIYTSYTSSAKPADVEILINGSQTRRTVNMPETTPETDYDRTTWDMTPAGAGTAPTNSIGATSSDTWEPSNSYRGTDQIKLKPKFTKDKASLTVNVTVDGVAIEDGAEIYLSGTQKGTTTSGSRTIPGLTAGSYAVTVKYPSTSSNASVTLQGTQTATIVGTTNATATLNFFTVTTANGTGSDWAIVSHDSSAPSSAPASGSTNSLVFLEASNGTYNNSDNEAYVHSAPKGGYTGSATWSITSEENGTGSSVSSNPITVKSTITAEASYTAGDISLTDGSHTLTYGDDVTSGVKLSNQPAVSGIPTGKRNYLFLQADNTNWANSYDDSANNGLKLEVNSSDEWIVTGTATKAGTFTYKIKVQSQETGAYTDEKTITITVKPKEINSVAVTGITAPQYDRDSTADPYNKGILPESDDSKTDGSYKGYIDNTNSDHDQATVTWTGGTLNGNKFKYGQTYTMNVTVKPDDNHVFGSSVSGTVSTTDGTLSNVAATVTKNGDGTVTVTYAFDPVYLIHFDANGGVTTDTVNNKVPDDIEVTVPATGATVTLPEPTGYSTGKNTWSKSGYTNAEKWDLSQTAGASGAHNFGATGVSIPTSSAVDGVITYYWCWSGQDLSVTMSKLDTVYNMTQTDWTDGDSDGKVLYQGRNYTYVAPTTGATVSNAKGTVTYALNNVTTNAVDVTTFLTIDSTTGKVSLSTNAPAVGEYKFTITVTDSYTEGGSSKTDTKTSGEITIEVHPIELDHAALSALTYDGVTNLTLDDAVTKRDSQITGWQGFYTDVQVTRPDSSTGNAHTVSDADINVSWSSVTAAATATAGRIYTATIVLTAKDSNYKFVDYDTNSTTTTFEDGWYVGTTVADKAIAKVSSPVANQWYYEIDTTDNQVILTKTFGTSAIGVTAKLTATEWNQLKVSDFVAATDSNVNLYYVIYDAAQSFVDTAAIKAAYTSGTVGTGNLIAKGENLNVAASGNQAQWADFTVTSNTSGAGTIVGDHDYYLYVVAEIATTDPAKQADANANATAHTPKHLTLTHNGYGSVSWTTANNHATSGSNPLGADSTLSNEYTETDVKATADISMFENGDFTAQPANGHFAFANWVLNGMDVSGLTTENIYNYLTGTNANDDNLHAVFNRVILGNNFAIASTEDTSAGTTTFKVDWASSYTNITIGGVSKGDSDFDQNSDANYGTHGASNTNKGIKYEWQQSTDNGASWTIVSGVTANEKTLTVTSTDTAGKLYKLTIYYTDPKNGGKETSISGQTGEQRRKLDTPNPNLAAGAGNEGGLDMSFPQISQETLATNPVGKYEYELFPGALTAKPATTPTKNGTVTSVGQASYTADWDADGTTIIPGQQYTIFVKAFADATNGAGWDDSEWGYATFTAEYRTLTVDDLAVVIQDKEFNGAAQTGDVFVTLKSDKVGGASNGNVANAIGTVTVNYADKDDGTNKEANKTHVNITESTTPGGLTNDGNHSYYVFISVVQGNLYKDLSEYRYTVTNPTKDINTDWEIYQTKAKLHGTATGTTTINTAYNVEAAIGAYVNYNYSGTGAAYNDGSNRITSHFDLTYKVTSAPAGSVLDGQTLTGTNLTAIKLDKEGSYTITVHAAYKDAETDQFKCDIAEPDDFTFTLTTGIRTVTGITLERYQAVNGTVGVTGVDSNIATGDHLAENREVIYAGNSWTATTNRIGFYDNSTNATSKEMSLVGLRVTVNWSAGDPDVYVIGQNDVSAFTLNVANTSVTGNLTDKKLTFVGAGSTNVTVSYGGQTSNAVEYVMKAKELTATVTGGNKIWDGNSNALNIKDESGATATNGTKIELNPNQTYATQPDTSVVPVQDTVTITATGFDYYNGSNKVSNVGNGYTVKASNPTLGGTHAGFYKLGTVTNGTGNITPRAITEVTITTPALYTGQTPNDVNGDVSVTAKDSLGITSVLDTSATTIKWQQLVGSTWTDINDGDYFMTGFQYRPIVDVKADTNHYLVNTRTPDDYTIDSNHNGEPTANEAHLQAKVTINADQNACGANNTGEFVGAPKPVGAVRPVLKFKDTYDGGTVNTGRAFEVDYRQIITVTVGSTELDNKQFSVYLGDFIADAKNVTVDYEAVNSNATDLCGSVTLTPAVPTNVGDMAKNAVYNEANGGYLLTLPAGIANTPGQYELSLSANGTSSDGLSQINTAHYHLIIVVKEKTGDGNGGTQPELKFSDSYANGTTIDTTAPGYLPSYTRVISMVEGDTIPDTEYLVSLKDFGVTANNVSVQVESNTIPGATVNGLPAGGLTLTDGQSQEWTVNLPASLSKGSYLLHITAQGENDVQNKGSVAHYYLVITVTEKKTEVITRPGDTVYVPGPTITTTVEVTAPIVTYWISEQGITNDLTAEKMAKKGDHPSFTPKVTGLDGYEFMGWSEVDPTTLPAGQKPVLVDPLTFEINEDKTFYAYYERVDNDHKNYVIGYPDGTFRPDAPITRAEVATIVARSCLDGFVEGYDYGNPGNYTDVNLKGWYASAVAYCTMMGVFTGYKDGTFRPAQYITREELATVVARLAGIRTNNGIPFVDASDVSKWARDGVYTCYAYGYINGYSDGTFRPQNDITRAETVKIFNGYLNRGVDATGLSGLTPFVLSGTASRGELDNGKQYLTWEDVPSKHWAYYEIIEASNTHDFHWPTKVENPPEDWDAAYIQEEWLARARYIITWFAGDGTASAATTREKLNATPVAPQILQTPAGKVFLGWASEPDGAVIDLTTYTVTGATTFYAVYGDKPDVYYTVSYETGLYGTADGDTAEQVKENGVPVAAPIVTADEDHIFLGWALSEDGAVENVAGYVVNANTVFYAVYAEKIKIYTVYYLTNEHGTLSGDTSEQVQAGKVPVSAPKVTPAEGYKFSGWSLSENGEIVNDAVYVITADTTFHAVYAELTKTYTVRYETNAYGTLSGETSEQVKAGNVPVAAPIATAVDGYVFKGWALSEGGAVVNDATYVVNENTTFYAVYAKKAEAPKLYTHKAFADGYADGSFHASEEVTRGAVADMLARIHSDYDPNYAYDVSQFTDIPANYWAANAIGYCVSRGIFTGTTETTFEPDRKITRQEFSVLIARMAGIQTNQGLPFTDASSVNKWARDAVYTVYVNGWITGYKDGTFQPKRILTRAEAVKIICSFLGRNVTRDSIPESLNVTSWSDVARKNWAYPYIMEATNNHTYYIDSNGNEVWVSTTASNSTLEVPTENTPSTEVLYTGFVNAASGLNARSAPTTGNNVIQVLPGNTQVEVLELVNDWSYIRFQNTAGDTATAYVKSEYITRNL